MIQPFKPMSQQPRPLATPETLEARQRIGQEQTAKESLDEERLSLEERVGQSAIIVRGALVAAAAALPTLVVGLSTGSELVQSVGFIGAVAGLGTCLGVSCWAALHQERADHLQAASRATSRSQEARESHVTVQEREQGLRQSLGEHSRTHWRGSRVLAEKGPRGKVYLVDRQGVVQGATSLPGGVRQLATARAHYWAEEMLFLTSHDGVLHAIEDPQQGEAFQVKFGVIDSLRGGAHLVVNSGDVEHVIHPYPGTVSYDPATHQQVVTHQPLPSAHCSR